MVKTADQAAQLAYQNGLKVSPAIANYLLPTPTTQDNSGKCRDHGGDLLHEIICGCERSERKLLPTPTVSDTFTDNLKSSQQTPGSMHSVTLPQAVKLLPTPLVDDAKNTGHNQNRYPTLASEVYLMPTPTTRDFKDGQKPHFRDDKLQTDTIGRAVLFAEWGKFEPAIRQWEQVTGRPAPAPTKPDGKDGQHRLSSEFSEWLMGLPQGWITRIGLKRNDELKACGNGVVPQQAALALSILDPQDTHE
jgi:DNA (cytosine-5)-methyltransferase 1